MEGKKTRGRQKIEMKKISNEEDLLISFSKRRSGIYKKASELVTLCGAEIAIIIFSPRAHKPYSFGHPSVYNVLNRFMQGHNAPAAPPPPQPQLDSAADRIVEAHRLLRMTELSNRQEGLYDDLDAERARSKLIQSAEAGPTDWWDAPLDGLALHELHERKRRLEARRAAICAHLNARPPPPPIQPPFVEGAGTAGAGSSGGGSTTAGFINPNNIGYFNYDPAAGFGGFNENYN